VPFDAAEFNNLALWLVEQRTDESSLRTAISRVYYAGHLLAVQALKRKRGWEPKGTGDDHGRVIRELRAGTTRGLSDRLDQLRMLREHADYHLEASESVSNRGCSFCKRIRESSKSAGDQNVTLDHWQNAKEVGNTCFSLLGKL
jgi:hypothetical protein